MLTVILGLNSMDPESWTTHEVQKLPEFLFDQFGDHFPETGKIFQDTIDLAHEITPDTERPETLKAILCATGKVYVIVYPAGPMIIGNTALTVGALTIDWLLHHGRKNESPVKLAVQTGSPNNKLGDRKNTARVLERIPDIYGDVRAFPDLLALPYTVYNDHREVETAYMGVGRGFFIITDIRDGDMLVGQIDGMSVAVYDPGQMPTFDVPIVQIGPAIADPVYIVKKLEAINGQTLFPENAFTFIGDIPVTLFTGDSVWHFTAFRNDGAGFGLIRVGGQPEEILDKVRVGDKLNILFPPDHVTIDTIHLNSLSANGHTNKQMVLYQGGIGSIPNLTGTGVNAVTVLSVNTADNFQIRVQIPPVLQAQWNLIDTFTASAIVPGTIGNGGSLITAQDAEWVGPFFLQVEVAPPRDQVIVCNFVAQNGLYADDGKSIRGMNVRIEVELTPCDSNGTPTGAPIQTESTVVIGTVSSRNTRAATLRIVPLVPGSFKVRARRLTRTPWKQDSPTQYICIVPDRVTGFTDGITNYVPALALTGPRIVKNLGDDTDPNDGDPFFSNSSYLPFHGNIQDEVIWASCYSLVNTEFVSFGDITTIHAQTIETRVSSQNKDRRLSCFARRLIQTWNGATFGGLLVQDRKCENILFTILKERYLGNLPDALIDFAGIAAAFSSTRFYFGGPTSDGFGGDEAGEFNYTFDDDKTTLEQMVDMVCTAGFCVPYRDGDVVKVKTDLATTIARLVVNHRNRLPGSETRTVTFGTEADYDSVRLDYVETDINDPTNYAIKTYTIPPNSVGSRPRILQIPGLRTKKHAAWQAWRAYNKLLYANTLAEFQVCQEAMQLTRQDRILMSDSTRTSPSDGEVTAVSGSTLTLSQPVPITSGTHTLVLQHTDGTVESIGVASTPTIRTVVLASPPSVALVTDPDLGVRTMYLHVKNDFSPPTAFLVQEKSCTGQGTYSITAGNYSHGFYFNDGLMFWLPFITQSGLVVHRDWGPYELQTSSLGASVVDGTRGTVYLGTANTQHISITTANVFASASYTKSAWVLRSSGVLMDILSSVESTDEQFRLSSTNQIRGVHNNTVYASFNAPNSIGGWFMYSMSYDSVTQVMKIYLNGVLSNTATGVPGRPLGNLRIFGCQAGVNGLVGRGDQLMYWMRVLTDAEIFELFQKQNL